MASWKSFRNWDWEKEEEELLKQDPKRRAPWDTPYRHIVDAYKNHVHYFQANDGDLDRGGRPRGRWVYVRCTSYTRKTAGYCMMKQARLSAEEYTGLDALGFILHMNKTETEKAG